MRGSSLSRRKRWTALLGGALLFLLLTHPGRFAVLRYATVDVGDFLARALEGRDDVCPTDPGVLQDFYHSADDDGDELPSHESLATRWSVSSGGAWRPGRDCVPAFKSLLVVPYRDRPEHLDAFLRLMHPYLRAQNLDYRIVVVEQTDRLPFNRAKLFNVGYAEEGVGDDPSRCLIFHDVDLIPLDGRNVYACTDSPRHMTANLDAFRYNLMYKELFGGAVAINASAFVAVNGFSNQFFGWGGEDDDFSQNRLKRHGLEIVRFDPVVSRYRALRHAQERKNLDNDALLAQGGQQEDEEDGLSTLKYRMLAKEKLPLYTRITVQL